MTPGSIDGVLMVTVDSAVGDNTFIRSSRYRDKDFSVLDTGGNVLFDTIDMSNAKRVSL